MSKLPALSKKVLTKLLNADFRKMILDTYTKDNYKLFPYAKYIVDSTIMSRDKTHEKDKNYGYGFSPINIVCAVLKDGTVQKRFLEFNTINHFLKDYQGAFAIEVAKCILILWLNENKNIKDFDYQVIDAELVKIEQEYVAAQKKQSEIEAAQLKERIEKEEKAIKQEATKCK